jgi:hypothetical protein
MDFYFVTFFGLNIHVAGGITRYLRLIVTILGIAAAPAYAQAQNSTPAKVTKADAQKVLTIISSDKVKPRIYSLDDPSVYGGAQKAIFTAEGQPFHLIADGVPAFEALPPRQ